jgi:tetratricopeptide (TPR) repeat protein
MPLTLLVAGAVAASLNRGLPSELDSPALKGGNRYDRCVELVRRNPGDALNAANQWQAQGGDGGATHCAALALVSLGRYAEAARTLDRLGHENFGKGAERATIFDQAGNAWLLAGQGGQAMESFSSALALSPSDPDLLADRARAAAMLGDWKATDDDLSAALARDANRADLLVLRASARRALGRAADAGKDLEQALHIVPDYPDALVERGSLKFETGDANGARADWQTAIARAPNSPAGKAAQQHLSELAPAKAK